MSTVTTLQVQHETTLSDIVHTLAMTTISETILQGGGGGGASLPAGGYTGQALVKASDATGDIKWDTPSPIDGGTFN